MYFETFVVKCSPERQKREIPGLRKSQVKTGGKKTKQNYCLKTYCIILNFFLHVKSFVVVQSEKELKSGLRIREKKIKEDKVA